MSKLVITAHVKDAVDLARQYHLPQSIIAFIEQHHGTTLVEYFYRQAERHSAETQQGGKVEEASFRYPGPKPQTNETAVLMLADAAESACRTLVEPTPARIESLVHEITMKRLLDGQFEIPNDLNRPLPGVVRAFEGRARSRSSAHPSRKPARRRPSA